MFLVVTQLQLVVSLILVISGTVHGTLNEADHNIYVTQKNIKNFTCRARCIIYNFLSENNLFLNKTENTEMIKWAHLLLEGQKA